MNIHLLAIGQRMPAWVDQGYKEYASRLSATVQIELREIPAAKRVRNSVIEKIKQDEGKRLLAAVPQGAKIIVLDEQGKSQTTKQLACHLDDWIQMSQDVAILIGGADGLSAECLQKADYKWSLSEFTFPHPLVRIILVEQMYRAWTLLNNHPYHRE
ncbi:MAG: 23S rRNA (pseudouridine(1915)-N(3))-methyltransferase RlmH [Gammaproteobacteria bacterium]|nr:23S rRNA (pseudouridine(1915)-N(3))-methyltransferase RlmH [Gammaproteobacteria bacterium]